MDDGREMRERPVFLLGILKLISNFIPKMCVLTRRFYFLENVLAIWLPLSVRNFYHVFPPKVKEIFFTFYSQSPLRNL